MPHDKGIRLFLFGDPRVEVDGVPFSFPPRSALLRLFVRLALQPNVRHSRKALAFSLWPDVSEAEALANLRRHLYLLRNALPETLRPALKISNQDVSFDLPASVWVDVTAFKQAASLSDMEAAAALYTADLAQGIEADDFILMRREELRIRYLDLLLALAQSHIENQDYAAVVRWAQKLMSLDPWNEEAARLYMTAEARLGNRAAALNVYKTLEKNLRNEIGAQPVPETMALYRDILHNRLPRAARRAPVERTPFIGRDHELAALQHALQDIQKKRGGFIFIHGPAGVGKTTLVREALRLHLPADAARVFWGDRQPADMERPYGLWRQIFNLGAPLLARRTDISAEWLAQLLPLVPDLSILRPELIPPAQPNTAELRSALRQGLYVLASDQPLVVVIEDAQWMDADSLEFLSELTEDVFQYPILFLITHRTENPPLALLDLKRALRRKRASQDILLKAFTPAETQSFLEAALPMERLPPETLAEVSRYAEGIPLFLKEAAQMLLKQRQTQTQGETLLSLQQSLRMRLENLDPSAREMLETTAALGFSIADHVLRAALPWTAKAYAAALDILQSERLLIENIQAGGGEYAFSHHLIHQMIVQEIPVPRLKQLRARAAQALERVHAEETGYAAEIASQYEQADLFPSAARFWLKHAQESADLAAFETALASLARAEGLLTDTDPLSQELHTQAVLQRGVIALYQGHGESALELLQQAVAQARPFPSLFANALSMQAYALYTRDQSEAAYRAADQAFTLSLTLQDIPNAVRALNIRAVSALMMGRISNAIDDLRHALSLLEQNQLSVSAQTVQSLNHLGTALVFAQDYAQARQILERTVELAHQGGLRRLEAAALTMLGQIALNGGRYENAIQIYNRAIEVAGSSYLPGMWGKFAGRGLAYLRSGQLEWARRDFEQGKAVACRVESKYGQLLMETYLVWVALAKLEPAPVSLGSIESQAAAGQLHPVVYLCATLRGHIRRLLGDWEQAQEAHETALQAALKTDVPNFILGARVQLLYDRLFSHPDLERIAELDEVLEKARAAGETPILAQGLLARGQFADDPLAARRLLDEGLSLAQACPDQPLVIEGLFLLGRLSAAQQNPDEAAAFFAQARAAAERTYAGFLLPLSQVEPQANENRVESMRRTLLGLLGE